MRVRLQDPGSSPYWGGNVARRENTPNRTLSFRYHKEKNKKERFPITSNARLPPPSGWKQTFPCPDTEMSKGKHYFQGDVFAMHCRSKPRDNDARQLRSSAPQGGQGRRRGATEGRPRGKRGETEGQGGPAACSPQPAARSTQHAARSRALIVCAFGTRTSRSDASFCACSPSTFRNLRMTQLRS